MALNDLFAVQYFKPGVLFCILFRVYRIMPRKRKKSCHQKPPLVFTESPVNKQRNVPTPVYCAQHPISVPRQSTHNMSWVLITFEF